MAMYPRRFQQLLLAASMAVLLGLSGCGGGSSGGSRGDPPTNPGGGSGNGNNGGDTGGGNGGGDDGGDTGGGNGGGDDGTEPGTPEEPTTSLNADADELQHTRTTQHPLIQLNLVGGWQQAAELKEDGAEATSPRVQYDASGNAVAIWAQGDQAWVSQLAAGAADWSAPHALADESEGAVHAARVAVDRASGNAIASWVQGAQDSARIYVSSFDKTTGVWSAAHALVLEDQTPVSSDPESSYVSMRGAHAAVVWRQRNALPAGTQACSHANPATDPACNIYLSRLENGSWTPAERVDTSGENALHPEVAVDLSGNATIVWRQRTAVGEFVINSRRWSASLTGFTAPVEAINTNGDRQPRIAVDDSGAGFALWRGGAGTGAGDGIFVRRLDAAGQWGATSSLHNLGVISIGGELSVAANGNAVAVWVEGQSAGGMRVLARRYDGVTGEWAPTEALSEAAGATPIISKDPTVAMQADELVVAWAIAAGPNDEDVMASRFTYGAWQSAEVLDTRAASVLQLSSAIAANGDSLVLWTQPTPFSSAALGLHHPVQAGDSWQSIAQHLYGVNSPEAGAALSAALGNTALSAGALLHHFPLQLTVTNPVASYYVVAEGDTWAHLAKRIYGTTDEAAITYLRTALGDPALIPGQELDVPAVVTFVASNRFTAPLEYSQTASTVTHVYGLDESQLVQAFDEWSPAAKLEALDVDANSPRVAFDDQGYGFATWAQGNNVMYSRYEPGSGWAEPAVLDGGSDQPVSPALVVDRVSGNAVVTWVRNIGTASSLHASVYSAASEAWQSSTLTSMNDNTVPGGADMVSVAIKGDQAAVAWLQHSDTGRRIYVSRLIASSWSAPQLFNGSGSVREPFVSVAVDLQGHVLAMWRQDGEIAVRRWDAALADAGEIRVLGDGDQSKVAFDDAGNAMLMWRQRGGSVGEGRVLVARLEAGASLTSLAPMELSGIDVIYMDLALDASGAALAAWVEGDSNANTLHARFFDPQNDWQPAEEVKNHADPVFLYEERGVRVALRDGNAVLSWGQRGAGVTTTYDHDVRVVRWHDGEWVGSQQRLDDDPARYERILDLDVALDADGEAVVVWRQLDGLAETIFTARSDTQWYYPLGSDPSWEAVAQAMYDDGSAQIAAALQAEFPPGTVLTSGGRLRDLPPLLTVVIEVPRHYVVQAGDTWESISHALYGTNNAAAVAALRAALADPVLTAGDRLEAPATVTYEVPAP